MYTEKILNTAYSFAAAVVVFGAWAKLEHKEFGGLALTIGLLVESGIFVIYGIVGWWESSSTAVPADEASSSPAGEAVNGRIDEATSRIEELKQTVDRTNSILGKIFRTGEV